MVHRLNLMTCAIIVTALLIACEIGAAIAVIHHQRQFEATCRAIGGESYFFGHVWDMTCIHFS